MLPGGSRGRAAENSAALSALIAFGIPASDFESKQGHFLPFKEKEAATKGPPALLPLFHKIAAADIENKKALGTHEDNLLGEHFKPRRKHYL